MSNRHIQRTSLTFVLTAVSCCLASRGWAEDKPLSAKTYSIAPGKDVQYRLLDRLIRSVPGDVIQLEAGRYEILQQLDLITDNITIRGQGSHKTILSFKGQHSGSQGILATGNNFTIEGLAIEDTTGNAIKVLGSTNVTFRDVRTEWTGPPRSSNGAYGLYPVQCQNVLIEGCTSIGASDAGLYVGQCRNVILRSSRAERNVAGIEIENTTNADVYDNIATNNAGGLLVFDLPGLPVKSGRNVRLFRNQVVSNNHPNFAAPGNIVASVPSGTGVMIMVTDQVEVFDNDILDNQTSSVSIISYLTTGKKIKSADFDPIPEAISIHDNRISGGGKNPQGRIAKILGPVLGGQFPDILFDGVVNPQRLVDGQPNLRIVDNGPATYVNFNVSELTEDNITAGEYRVVRDLDKLTADIGPLPPVQLSPHDPPSASQDSLVRIYRSAPARLSQFGLFEGNGSTQEPAEDVVPYDLNTALFSDYTRKHRFIRIPDGTHIEFRSTGVFEFPVGTIIAKTFSSPHDMTKPELGERLLETRIEARDEDGWYGFSYQWNEQQTDALLVLGGGEIDTKWIHSDGTLRTNRYQIPNANQCLNCHIEDKEFVPIGPVAGNLNRPLAHASEGQTTENQLAYMARLGKLKELPPIDRVSKLPRFDHPSTGSVSQRARAWLDVNCAHCHNPRGSARTSGLDLRLSQSDPAKIGVWKSPVAAGHGSGGRDYDVVPGKPDESILLFRIESENPSIMMPNVARRLVPTEAVALIREWIEQMETRDDCGVEHQHHAAP